MIKVNVLGKQYVIDILLYLYDREETTTVDLKNISSYYQGVVRRAEELEKLSLLEIKIQRKPYLKKTFSLTSKGKEIAEALLDAEDMVLEGKAKRYKGWI
ncbi:MAG: hypothetical protein R6U61_01120 [Thermoplasmata archaeon]